MKEKGFMNHMIAGPVLNDGKGQRAEVKKAQDSDDDYGDYDDDYADYDKYNDM